ncbi:MAG: hypothetical protein QM768_11520 [Agriterribacter sp.]
MKTKNEIIPHYRSPFIITFICIIPLNSDIQEYNVQKNSEFITATIIYIPIYIGTKVKYLMKFAYAGQQFAKKVAAALQTAHKAGDTFKLKHMNGINDIFFYLRTGTLKMNLFQTSFCLF